MGEKELYELGHDKFGEKWYIILLGDDDLTEYFVMDEAHKGSKDLNFDTITPTCAFSITSNIMELLDIDIYPEYYRKRGIGTLIINFIEKLARSKGVLKIEGKISETDDLNHLQRFYGRLGFTVTPYKNKQGVYVGSIEKILQ